MNLSGYTTDFKAVREAYARLGPFIHRTPIMTSRTADERANRQLFFKAENLQKTGAFKIRGALNAVLQLRESNPHIRGVVCHATLPSPITVFNILCMFTSCRSLTVLVIMARPWLLQLHSVSCLALLLFQEQQLKQKLML
jgi:hypothetical protein